MRFVTLGWKDATLKEAAGALEKALGSPLSLRDSSYYGGEYYTLRRSSEYRLIRYRNHDEVRGELVRASYREFAVLLEVTMPDTDNLQHELTEAAGAVLLRTRIMPDEPAAD